MITRNNGRTAVGAAAYMSCSKIKNEYDGITHDYRRKQGLMYERTFLPSHAPPEWADRSVLWNAVESVEKTKDSRLSRELIVALPTELTLDENISMLEQFIQSQFVDDGMCADVAIHDTDGHNPHAHIMLTVRPLKENGTWAPKTEKEYLCIRGSEEKAFTASEFLSAQIDGWEKQYCYLVDGKKRYLPPSMADGLERINKYPKSSKYGRQNPITDRWNTVEQLRVWRAAWANAINRELRARGYINLVDHRSFKDRGLPYQPTIHEGIIAIALERKGIVSERCEHNRQIRKDNSVLDYWAEAVVEFSKVAGLLIIELVKAIEMLLSEIHFQLYVRRVTRRAIKQAKSDILKNEKSRPVYVSNIEKAKAALAAKKSELKEAKEALAHISPLFKLKRKAAEAQIDSLSEEISEFESEITLNEQRMKSVDSNTAYYKEELPKWEEYERQLDKTIDGKLAELGELKEKAKQFDTDELLAERMNIRKESEPKVVEQIKETYGDIDFDIYDDTQRKTAELFGDEYASYTDYRNDHPKHKQKDSIERQ